MIPEYFALVGSLFASTGGFYYLYCTIKGTVQPNKITWFFWGAFPMIAFAAQYAQDVGFVLWATFAAGFTPFLIVVAASFNKDAYWEIKTQDYLFAAIGVVGVILWQITDEPNLALTFALLAAFMSVQVWTYENYAFVLYLFLVNTLIMMLAARKPKLMPVQ